MERVIGIRILALGLLFCVLGCERDAPKPPPKPAEDKETAKKEAAKPRDPLAKSDFADVQFVPAADGTVYFFLESKAFWLVDGEATQVTDNEGPSTEEELCGTANYLDANGGLYVSTSEHLWYLKDGRAKKISVVDRASLTNKSPKVSTRTLLWAVRHHREELIREKASESGEQMGRDAGYEQGLEEGRAERRK